MPPNKYVYVLGMLLILSNLVVFSSATCDSLLLSIDDAGICEDGVCRTSELAQVRTKLGKDHSVCFRVDQHQFDIPDKIINFTIVDSWISYPVHSCYLSDDPQISVEGYCACPLVSTVDCSHCDDISLLTNDTVCVDGINRGTGCFGFRTATHCVKTGFDGGQRYKVCEIGEGAISIVYSAFNTIHLTGGDFVLTDQFTIQDDQFSITFYDIDKPTTYKDKKLVLDLLNPGRSYVVPRDRINDKSENNPNKLGWYRFNQTVNPKVRSLITVDVQDCSNDQFIIGVGVPTFSETFNANPSWQLQKAIPGAVWSDPDSLPVQAQQVIYDPPLPPLSQGAYFMDTSGIIFAMGLDQNGMPVSTGGPQGSYDCFLFNNGNDTCVTPGFHPPVTCGPSHMVRDEIVSDSTLGNYKITQLIAQCNSLAEVNPGGTYLWATCQTTYIVYNNGTQNTDVTCNNIGFAAKIWPDNIVTGVIININPPVTRYLYGGVSTPAFTHQSEQLTTKNVVEAAKLDIVFKNITIKFDVTNVDPRITRLDHDDDEIRVWAESTSVKGSCILMTSDDVTPTKSIELTLTPNKYTLPIIVDKFKGDINVILQCYKNREVVKFYVEVERGNLDLDYKSINATSVRRLSKELSTWEKVSKNSGRVWDWITDQFSVFFQLTSSGVANWFIGIILSIVVLALIPVALYASYLVLKWVLCKLWNLFKQKILVKVMPGKFKMNGNNNSIKFTKLP